MVAPKLRFKEFDGDWNSIAIGHFLKIKSGLGFKAEEYTTEEEIRLLQIENVGYGAVKWTHNVKFVPSNYLELHRDLVLNEGDLVLALNRPVTNDQLKIAKLTKEDTPSILYQRVGKLDFLKKDFDRDFIFQIFLKDVKSYVLNSSIGSDQPFISTTDLYKHKLSIPSKEEQTKIAAFLSAVDEKISQLTQKHQLLSQYKQGMMQKLFSQEIRFKADDGSEFGEWEEKPLNHYLYTSKLKNKDLKFSKQEVLSVSGELGVVNQIELLGRSYAGVSVAPYSVVEHADIVYTKSPLKSNPYGIIKVNKGKAGIVSTLYAVYKCKDNIYPELIDYYFQSDLKLNHFLKPLVKKGAKNDMKVNNDHVLTGIVSLPSSLEEQTKIAYFLSAIDQKIEVVAQQIEQAKQWKKGLLQQMIV
ncbi:restriction endonuclease subunit S [Acinetobacter sp. Lyrl_1]|uniref:restriction endonuclease subunit S n=1 Tax=Acinetobacter sp. Lyrl_1 TaxID=3110920 RepID=UPI003F7C0288